MARTGRPMPELVLWDGVRAALGGWVRRRSTPQACALRCRIILACAEGASNKDVAAGLGSTAHAVGRRRAFGLQAHRSQTFKLSTDPYFVDEVHDVVGLCLDSPEQALVFCADEKSRTQALDRSQPVLPMMPGVPQRVTHDYVRAGTTTLFAALEVATGK
ncbi:IS630 family transposase, partial [Streptomyces sp. SR27]|nr:IS630 family transposase [Streptomyces sp. SR27]